MGTGVGVAVELAASLDDVGAFVAGAALTGAIPVAGFVAGPPAAGAEEIAVESGVGWVAAGGTGAPATFEGGALGVLEVGTDVGAEAVFDAGGGVEFISVPSELCAAAGLLALAFNHGIP